MKINSHNNTNKNLVLVRHLINLFIICLYDLRALMASSLSRVGVFSGRFSSSKLSGFLEVISDYV